MFDSIFIGMSGMEGFSKGLKVISNNVANLNTPGFKSSNLQFTDAYYQQGSAAEFSSGNRDQPTLFGSGLDTLAASIDFKAGDTQQTSNPLDVSITGEGFLISQDKTSGAQAYTRDGQMQFDKDGNLTSTTTGKYIMGYSAKGAQDLQRMTLGDLKTSPPKATTKVTLTGNLTYMASSQNTDGTTTTPPTPDIPLDIAIDDAAGTSHTLHVVFKYQQGGHWDVVITDPATQQTVGGGPLDFNNGKATVGFDSVPGTYKTAGADGSEFVLDCSQATSYAQGVATGSSNQISVASQDGYSAGAITKSEFDADGVLTLTYSNGQTAKGGQLALAQFSSLDLLQEQGGGEFTVSDPTSVALGRPSSSNGSSIASSQFEMSNVDLSGEFSNLIVMQRGYQASSNILSTANDMLQQLFDMRGGR